MTLALALSPLAQQDVVDLADYIACDNVDAAMRFLDAAEAATQRLVGMPELGAKCNFSNPLAEGIRVWPITGFRNYLVFYRIHEDRLEIIRVLHGTRDYDTLFEA